MCKSDTHIGRVDSAARSRSAADIENRLYRSIDTVGRHQEDALMARRDVFQSNGLQYTMITEVRGDLHSSMNT